MVLAVKGLGKLTAMDGNSLICCLCR